MSAAFGKFRAMISSTSLDLPFHRAQVVEACLRQGIFPIDMKYHPARESSPKQVDKEMVENADVYIGIYAYRYGGVEEELGKSYTELEFETAVEQGIDCLIFLMSPDHTVSPRDVETANGAQEKLSAFKARACKGRVWKEFASPEDLRSQVVDALAHWKLARVREAPANIAHEIHPHSQIRKAPKPYVAHPYVLLQTPQLVGRRLELNLLTDWITKNSIISEDIRVFVVAAMGGMGKSALTWKWFESIAPNELPSLHGRIWWSFYESDAHWENFIIRALAYTADMPELEVRQLAPSLREDRLLQLLDERPFLVALDGMERILLAYARMDAAHLRDEDVELQTSNDDKFIEEQALGVIGRHRLRQCADLRVGTFLRKLTRVRASRILVSTRLCPAELQTETSQMLPGSHLLLLGGLADDDALALWREFIGGDCSGTSEQLKPIFGAFGNYPLLLRALAGEVAQYRPSPGDFERWSKDHPSFNPHMLPLANAKTHVLEHALSGLASAPRRVLATLAAFRMPVTWEALVALLVGDRNTCMSTRELDAILTELEDRGLVGWDKYGNRYDLHPVVRAVVSNLNSHREKTEIYGRIRAYFSAFPKVTSQEMVRSIEDLSPAIELYFKLTELARWEEAFLVYERYLSTPLTFALFAGRRRVELLERLFVTLDPPVTPLKRENDRAWLMFQLGRAYVDCGFPHRGSTFFRLSHELRTKRSIGREGPERQRADLVFRDLSEALRVSGNLRDAELAIQESLAIVRSKALNRSQGVVHRRYGLLLAATGRYTEAFLSLKRGNNILEAIAPQESRGAPDYYLAQYYLWTNNIHLALDHARRSVDFVRPHHERDAVRARRMLGSALLANRIHGPASDYLGEALARSRAINYTEEEIAALVALAQLHHQRQEFEAALDMLAQVWVLVERGPYRLLGSDAQNVLSQIHQCLGNSSEAVEAAIEAYGLAWCDGPPYAYNYGLIESRRHIKKLEAAEPLLSSFDKTKFSQSGVQLNPNDEFWVNPESLLV